MNDVYQGRGHRTLIEAFSRRKGISPEVVTVDVKDDTVTFSIDGEPTASMLLDRAFQLVAQYAPREYEIIAYRNKFESLGFEFIVGTYDPETDKHNVRVNGKDQMMDHVALRKYMHASFDPVVEELEEIIRLLVGTPMGQAPVIRAIGIIHDLRSKIIYEEII